MKPVKVIIGVLILLLVFAGGAYVWATRTKKSFQSIPPTQTSQPSPTPMPNSDYLFINSSDYLFHNSLINSLDDALKNVDRVTDLSLCNKKLAIIPPTIGNLTKVEYMDLSENSLTSLPNDISKLSSLKELILVDNNFDAKEQLRIKQLIPKIIVAFVPQKGFNPYIEDNWKTHINTQYGFSFKYHPELKVNEHNNGVSIVSDLVGFERAFASCSVDKAYIKLWIAVEDNPGNLSPVNYLENALEIQINQQGDKYVVDKEQAMRGMIGEIKNYKNGDIEGLISDAGESEHPRIVASHNGKFYIFQYLPGGETGSSIPDIAKKTLDQSLATFKY